ncbi:MAG: endonuclease/exonuclease/phosphatase family protein [Bacteroidota bacterium]
MYIKSYFIFIASFFLFTHVNAQSVENIGNDNTLDIATWNIEWFGNENNGPSNTTLQLNNAAAVISGSGVDLWGVQEIADGDDFETLLATLGDDYDGRLATNSGEQKVGFIYNTNVIRVRQVRHILESFAQPFAFRPPLQLEADIMLPDTTVIVTFIVLHMKAFSDPDSYERRVDASGRLKNHIDFTTLESEHVVVLGDFNDELERSTSGGRPSPYANFIEDPDDFAFVTLPIEEAGDGSFCNNSSCTSTGNMLDHILITNELFGDYISNSAGFIPDLPDDINLFGSSTSDHLPVVARFDFSQVSTSTEIPEGVQATLTVDAPYPNPFVRESNLSLQLAAPAALRVDVYDLLGRRVETLENRFASPGAYQYVLPADNLTPGVYLVRVAADQVVKTMPVTLR